MEKKVTCDLCPELAKTNCPKCGFINMCPGCCQKHDSNSRKSEHEVFGLCYEHGKPLTSYCRTCNQAVCSACEISEHNDEHHDVTSHRVVLDETLAKSETSFTELSDAVLQVDREVKRMLLLRAYVLQKSGYAEVEVTAKTNNIIIGTRTKIKDLRDQIQDLKQQINELVEQKDEIEQRANTMEKDVYMLEMETAKIATDVRAKITTVSTKTEQHIMMVKSRKIVMESKIEQRRAETSVKIILDAECVSNLSSISQELVDFAKTSPEGDINTVIEEVERLVDELMPNIKLKTVGCINFPKERQCNYVRKIKNLPDGRLSILCRVQANGFPDTIFITDQTSVTITGMIVDGIAPANDMALISAGELVVTRREKPPIRIFKPDSGAYRDINIKHRGKVIDKLFTVKTDGDDNMFVMFRDDVLVLKPTGKVITVHSMPLSFWPRNMAFSKVNRILYITTCEMLLRLKWSNNKLKEISSSPHGIKGLRCLDVCLGSCGEVLVAGSMENRCITIYQVEDGDGGEVCVWREINFQDNLERKYVHPHWPCFCSEDNKLWLGYTNKVEAFQMLSS